MKILIDSFGPPAFLAHGGATTQVLETANALRELGLEVEFARWWDKTQVGDIIHTFGVPKRNYINFAREKGIPIVNTTLFTATCNRSARSIALQGAMISTLLKLPRIPPWGSIRSQLNWDCFAACDLNIVGLNVEAAVLRQVYSVPDSKIQIVPLGLSKVFLEAERRQRIGECLITTGTITERKRSIELAKMAKAAEAPILFVGKPYDKSGDYWKEFKSMIDGKFVRHIPHTESVVEMVKLLKNSKGFVLYSDYENWCLSAHEAIACGVPIIVPDQPWSRELFGEKVNYLIPGEHDSNVQRLKSFDVNSPSLCAPEIKLFSWKEAASQMVVCYEKLLKKL